MLAVSTRVGVNHFDNKLVVLCGINAYISIFVLGSDLVNQTLLEEFRNSLFSCKCLGTAHHFLGNGALISDGSCEVLCGSTIDNHYTRSEFSVNEFAGLDLIPCFASSTVNEGVDVNFGSRFANSDRREGISVLNLCFEVELLSTSQTDINFFSECLFLIVVIFYPFLSIMAYCYSRIHTYLPSEILSSLT